MTDQHSGSWLGNRKIQTKLLLAFGAILLAFLCLGNRENIDFAPAGRDFAAVDAAARIFRKNAGNG